MDQVIWGMIGCGDVTEVKSGPGLYKAKRSSLRAVYSRTHSKAQDYARRHGVPVVYETAQELFDDPEINAVYIATPPDSHCAYALECIRAGKVPYIEKPLAPTYEECARILAAAEAKGLPVYVALYRRAVEKYKRIKELIDSGAIGQVRYVQVRHIAPPAPMDYDRKNLPWRILPPAGGGRFVDGGIHILDYLAYFFGEITQMTGQAVNQAGLYPVEDTVSASFRFESGVVGSGLFCYVADHRCDEVVITGSTGHLSFACADCGGEVHLIQDGKETVLTFEAPEHAAMPMIQSIVDELTGHGKTASSAHSAANTTKRMDEVLAAYRARHMKP